MKKPIELSDNRGLPLLKFLWAWKLVSTPALARKFFPKTTNPFTTYNWLLHLKHEGYISQRWDEKGKFFFWTLDRAGFAIVQKHLPPLREEGFRAEHPEHDWLASAFHLGPWLVNRPEHVQLFTEQQLRRLELNEYPKWVPRNLSHRPDGYWHRKFNGERFTVALEMEISRKKAAAYQSVGSFYSDANQINRVLWIVRTSTDIEHISKNLMKAPGSSELNKHSYVKLDSFLKQGWSAKIECGSGHALTVESYLHNALRIPKNDIAVTSSCHDTTMSLLETRIRRGISASSGIRREGSLSRLTTVSTVVTPTPQTIHINNKSEAS